MILGIDEVGRGAWAGPLVVGAVVLGCEIDGLTDSKMLTKSRRELLYDEIMEHAAGVGLGWVSAEEIDETGLSSALRLATRRAIQNVQAQRKPFHEIIIDGTINFLAETPLSSYVTTMKKADLLIPSVSAASIVAKVERDRYMVEQAQEYPEYKFASHVGYGTAVHRQAIEVYGVTPLHRLSIAPLRHYAGSAPEPQPAPKILNSSTRRVGDDSETAAAKELARSGHTIIERNWKTKYCEIDIVSRKDGTYYFTEVKHRRNDKSGDGLAAITPKKLKQMEYAARFYSHSKKITGFDLCLLAISTSGNEPAVMRVETIEA